MISLGSEDSLDSGYLVDDYSLSADSIHNVTSCLDSLSYDDASDYCTNRSLSFECNVYDDEEAKFPETFNENNKSGCNAQSQLNSFFGQTRPTNKRASDEQESFSSRKKLRKAFDEVKGITNILVNRKTGTSNIESSTDDESQENKPYNAKTCDAESAEIKSILHKKYSNTVAIQDRQIKLVINRQPEKQHRARYLTEGSRGAVKDCSGNSYPEVKLLGYNKPVKLQVFIGTEDGVVQPHLSYQASKVCGKHATSCKETKIDQTTVLETQLTPEENMTLSCDCIGILKIRNVDTEKRVEYKNSSHKRKCTRCRLIFRVRIPNHEKSSGYDILQIASSQISCTQPPGTPEILKKSLSEWSATGQKELFIIGKNFHKDSIVIFEEVENDQLFSRRKERSQKWKICVKPDKEYLNSTHLICEVPPYQNKAISMPVNIQLSVASGGKISEPHIFTYNPFTKQDNSGSITAQRRIPENFANDLSSSVEIKEQGNEQKLSERCSSYKPSESGEANSNPQLDVAHKTAALPVTTINLQSHVSANKNPLPNSVLAVNNAVMNTNLPSIPDNGANSFQPIQTIFAPSIAVNNSPQKVLAPVKLKLLPGQIIQGSCASTAQGILPNASSILLATPQIIQNSITVPISMKPSLCNVMPTPAASKCVLRYVSQNPSYENQAASTNVGPSDINVDQSKVLFAKATVQPGCATAEKNTFASTTNHLPPALPAEGYKDDSYPFISLQKQIMLPSQENSIKNDSLKEPCMKNKEYSNPDQVLVDTFSDMTKLTSEDLLNCINIKAFDTV